MGDGQQVERSSSVDPIVWPRVGQGQREGEWHSIHYVSVIMYLERKVFSAPVLEMLKTLSAFAVAVFTCHCTIITVCAMDMNDEKR